MTRSLSESTNSRKARDGIAAAELAVLLPLLTFLFIVGLDFARLYYAATTLSNCARNGALYQADPYVRAESRYTTVSDAALADASNLLAKDPNNPPTVSTATSTDSSGRPTVEVTVSYEFRLFVDYPGIPARVDLSRTVVMPVAPNNPVS